MSTYKVLQDIEAEDKFVGPLTLKQFIFAGVTVLCLYFCFWSITRQLTWLLIVLLPPAIVCGFFAWPWGRDQPTEVWLLAKIRFFFKPRRRIWNSNGIEQLVTITAPKRSDKVFTNNLTQTEVTSRLRALADTIDSRGWAIKNVDVNMFTQPALANVNSNSDRLIDMSSLPQEVSAVDIHASDDILDETSNPIAQHLNQMIEASNASRKQQVMQQLQTVREGGDPAGQPGQNMWFLHPDPNPQPGMATFTTQVVAPGTDPATSATTVTPQEEDAIREELEENKAKTPHDHHRVLQPLSDKPHNKSHKHEKAKSQADNPDTLPAKQMTQTPDPAILGLANNDDLNVATIARQANKARRQGSTDEVVISLR